MRSLPGLKLIRGRLHWLSCWLVHDANQLRYGTDGQKVGWPKARCASMATAIATLNRHALRPQESDAVKPRSAQRFRALLCLAGSKTLEKIRNFLEVCDDQSYPSGTKDSANVAFSTGSVGLGVAISTFASLVQDYVRVRGPNSKPEGRMVALCRLRLVHGHRMAGLGVVHFGQTGSVADLCRHFGIDRVSIPTVIETVPPRRPLRAVRGLT